MPTPTTRRSLLAAVLLVPLATAVGCGGDEPAAAPEEERPLSSEEAQLLALVRFRFHQEKQVPVTMTWPGEDEASVVATLDLAGGIAFGTARWDEGADAGRLIGWSGTRLTTAAVPADGAALPALGDWATRALSTSVVRDLFLQLALSLGSDRPENPVLLQQGSARFVRHDEVNGVEVSVMSGPRPADEAPGSRSSRTRYWIDADGNLQRFEAYLGDAEGRFAQLTRGAEEADVAGLADRVREVLRIAGGGNGAG